MTKEAALADGYYWTRSSDPSYPQISIAEWKYGYWKHMGVSATIPPHEIEVVSGPVMSDQISAMKTTSEFSTADLQLFRQWFDAVQDVNPAYLETADFALARRIYERLGMRVPHSILRGETDQ